MSQKVLHLSQRNQILTRPAQHIGSTKCLSRKVWSSQIEYVEGSENESIVEQDINYNPGLIHIFYEVLSNAQDNYIISKNTEHPLHKIQITVDENTGKLTVWNDGQWISNTLHKWSKHEEMIDNKDHYEAEIIFGHLNSSSNYDKKKIRIGGGLHGVGVKLTNIFSSEFNVDCFDPATGVRFRQTYTNNMSVVGKPNITSLKQKKGYTKISYIADFKRFGVDGYSDDHLSVIRKLCIDCAMITGQTIIFNGEKIPIIKNFRNYVKYYHDILEYVEFKSADSTLILCEKPEYEVGFSHISFVNGIYTSKGGVHVDEWKREIFRPLLEKINKQFVTKSKQTKTFKFTIKNLENYFMLFLTCNLDNPEFEEGQTKGLLCSPTPKIDVPDSKIVKLMKWRFIDDIKTTIDMQGMKEMIKTDGKKSASVSIPKAIDANKAGTAKSLECTLFITEGDSAKTFATKGISTIENGTDWYGALPIRGKLLNVRNETAAKINNNKEIGQIKQILGLKHGADYSDHDVFRTLRYGKVCILTDADPDGDHIKGLLINFFQYFYPELISCGYLTSIRTPIVKATIGKKTVTFYYLKDFREWSVRQTQNFTAKYYKGLGTSTNTDIYEIFEDPRSVKYLGDLKTFDSVDMIFGKKNSNLRKEWLETYIEKEFKYPEKNGNELVKISDFFNNEMIGFSIHDNQRSIPSVIDGFKPSQRKAMWVGLEVLNETTDYKVAQFAAEAGKRSQYHHGEHSLEQTIIGMAQTFVGSNNIALLFESGQFGTRLQGGADAAAARYIYTHLPKITRYIFRKEDDPILEYLEDEGHQIEPKFFVPIIPMLLVNGSTGIGTGYSTKVPAFNPLDLVAWIIEWLNHGDPSTIELIPWYHGFKGTVVRDDVNSKKFKLNGEVNEISANVYEITELPVGVWTDTYIEHLNSLKHGAICKKPVGYNTMTVPELKENLISNGLPVSGSKKVLIDKLKKFDKEHGTPVKKSGSTDKALISKWEWRGDAYNVCFKIWTKPGVVIECGTPKFKLMTDTAITNMYAFTPNGGLKKYEELDEILETFCTIRLDYYVKRKKHLVKILKENLQELKTKARFIKVVLDDYKLLKRTEDMLFEYFNVHEYYMKNGSYKYLTDMPVRNFTANHYQALLDRVRKITLEIDNIKNITPKQTWLKELDEFVHTYEIWKKTIEKFHSDLAKKKFKRRTNH